MIIPNWTGSDTHDEIRSRIALAENVIIGVMIEPFRRTRNPLTPAKGQDIVFGVRSRGAEFPRPSVIFLVWPAARPAVPMLAPPDRVGVEKPQGWRTGL